MSEEQLPIFDAFERPRPRSTAVMHRSADPRPAAVAATTREIAGLGFGELYFIPRAQLEIGVRVVRWDDCRRCGAETSHVFTLIALRPRVWARACLECVR